MPLRIKKETFLLNQSNKQRFVEILMDTFQEHSIEAIQAKEDADLLIVKTAVEKSNRQEVVIYGEDTHLPSSSDSRRSFSKGVNGKDDVCKADEEALVNLYGGMPLEGLDILRWRKFTTKTMALNRSSIVLVQTLPATSDAAKFHSMRVYLQCQYWRGKTAEEMDPLQLGLTMKNEKLFPIEITKQPAPEFLLKIIHCNCKTDCDNRRCSCRKNGISCSSGCGECRGINCSNSKLELDELDIEENNDT
ncbi:unnamed protein product [Mytilus coruscus]|uniref:Tesmin/TSO1-like CXC domain-containing protein n=1 Tax=Mytilus coruscus TaxID=42192 RepID=A0A6J8DCM7_MYTCO|nr:unnamed protein product [Mytilus coruscus]